MAACKGVLPMATSSLVPLPQPDQPGLFNPTRALGGLSPLPPDASSVGSIDPDIAEVYFLVMHFLASGPCTRAFGQLWNELLQHKLLPRRFHAWYARDRKNSGNEDDDGLSLPLSYTDIVTRWGLRTMYRHPHVEPGHLVKLLQQLLVYNQRSVAALEPAHSRIPTAADVPTLLGAGAFSLLDLERSQASKGVSRWTRQLRWPHWEADQVHGLMLRELGGGFARHHRAPSLRTASYVVTKPAVLVDRIQIIKKLRGHRNAVYCAIFDRTGQYVITGSDDRLVKIWSTETGLCLRSCRGHEGDITDLAVSSGNTLVASASNDYSIRVWQLPNGVPISLLRGHTASVTAISFSPRQGCEHLLLSTSDDGTCRIWNAKNSSLNSRVYMPNPKDAPATSRAVGAPTPVGPPNNQVLCGAFNADGTIFVTGSSDKMARVWDARKWNDDVTGRPNYELDTLKGHENDVNYVQFSGCAAPSRPWVGDMSKEDHHFKNSWSAHDSIVTCSRDGSAIIWTPRTRKYHGKVGRWQKAYHLRVPPPPMPPQPPRGNGPRHRVLPTPLGVNMIVWSLDNRFVLAAIMDHRICVWNAVDGSLVHSLTGHDKQTYVLDVHPFNPRIAMSAGYDGRVIIWDIWEGHPIKVYDTGEYNLVDGNFSPDGSSLVVSDEVGQIYIFGTGPGMAQKDVKYDQFFLGDFRPLVRDTFGNVLDAETQLPPHQRNIQDLLCDANLIPYPEPYQSLYQQRRLGALGIEWTPSNVFLSIGTTDDVAYTNPSNLPLALPLPIVPPSPVQQNRRGPQTAPGNRWVEQPSEVDEAMDWEQEVAGLSEDTGSDYSASEESRSEEAGGNQGGGDSHEEEAFGSEEEGWEERDSHTHLRRSGRNKRKAEEYIQTASGRRVRRRTFNDDDSHERRPRHIPRASRPGPSTARAVQDPPSARPRRQAARNALTLFTSINSICDEEEENTTTQAPSQTQSAPTAVSVQVDIVPVSVIENPVLLEQAVESQASPEAIPEQPEHVLQIREDATTSNPEAPENPGDCKRPRSQRRLIVKLRSGNPPRLAAENVQSEGVEGVHEQMTDVVVTLDDTILSVPESVTADTISAVQPEGPSQRSVRKLVVKPPVDPNVGAHEVSTSGHNDVLLIGNDHKVPLLDSDGYPPKAYTDMSHEEKRKWEWKKVKAIKCAQGSNSSDHEDELRGSSCLHNAGTSDPASQAAQNSQEAVGPAAHNALVSSVLDMCGTVDESNMMVSVENDQNEGCLPSSHLAAKTLKSVSETGVLSLEEIGDESRDYESGRGIDVTSVDIRGFEGCMSHMNRTLEPVVGMRTEEGMAELDVVVRDPMDCLPETSPCQKDEELRLIEGQEEIDAQDQGQWEEQEVALHQPEASSSEEALACEANGVSFDHSDPEHGILESTAQSIPPCTDDDDDDDDEGDAIMFQRGGSPQTGDLDEKAEATESAQEDDAECKPPLYEVLHWNRARAQKQEEESVEKGQDQDSDQDEDGEEANNGGACYEEMPTRTHEWTESGEKESDDESMGHHNQKAAQRGKLDLYTRQATSSKESDDESMEASVQSMGHKNQKVQGKLASHTRQVTSKWPQQSTGNGSSRNRREHESQSAPLRSNGETSVKTSNHASSALDSSRSMATPSILSEHKDFSLPSTRQKRSTVQNKQWRGELSSERSLRLHQVVKVEKTLSQSSSEKPPKTSVRSQRIPKQEVTGSIIRCNLKCEYGSPDRLKSSAHARRGHSEAENRKAVEMGPVALNSRTRGQRRGRQSGKAGSRNMELMSWLLMEEVEPGTQFIPQYGDQVVYLRQGHEDFLEKAKLDEKGPWKTLKQPIAAVEYCRIKGLDYLIEQGTGKTNCKVSLEFNDPESQVYGKSFKLTLPELTDQPDFLVERNRYDASIQMGWRVRDHCKVWWAKEDDEGKGGSWWDGRIKLIRPTSSEFPDSPWESFHVTYKESSEPTPHSPWELFDKECKISGYNIPQIDPSLKESLLSIIRSMTDNSCRETKFGLIQHQKDSQNAEFINRIALPLSFDIISARVERDYYHCVEALEHDIHLLVTNTKLFHGKDSVQAHKMQQMNNYLLKGLG